MLGYFEYRCLKRLFLNIESDFAFFMCLGNEFHVCAPENEKLFLHKSILADGRRNSSPRRELSEERYENRLRK